MRDITGKTLSGKYIIDGFIAEGAMNYVYSGKKIDDGTVVAVKVLKAGKISKWLEDMIRFRKEIEIVSGLSHRNLAKIYGTGMEDDMNFIVMEKVAGESMRDRITSGRGFSLEDSVKIMSQLADVLDYVHSAGVIHRDIKPGNIMLSGGESDLQVKLLDFGLAEIMELSQIKEAGEISGTFSYMSPEQTGILGKPADERSDLYSLGVIFYRLVAGELPFKGTDVAGILHQQIAQQPTPPSQLRKDIQDTINEIILKLLKKDPEERYQTAKGLLADLREFSSGTVSFIPGKNDRLKKLTYRTRLMGRKDDFEKLKALYASTLRMEGKVCLISGEAGIGKSRLMEEFRSYVYEQGGEFLSGKCFQQDNKVPYQPFIEIMNEYVHLVMSMSAQEKEKSIKRMKESAGELGEIVCRLNPVMRDVLGEVPSLVGLDPDKENQRFQMVCSRFFRALGEKGKPVVIALDDIQWVDDGSLSLLSVILEELRTDPVLVIGSYRDNEIKQGHRLPAMIKYAGDNNLPLEEIHLKNLSLNEMNDLLGELLQEDTEKTLELNGYLLEKSKGNPFFAIEIVRRLVDENVLVFGSKNWEIDQGRLNTVAVSPTILEVLMKRIELLNGEQMDLLSIASVVGKTFNMELLYRLSGLSKEKTIGIVDECVKMQLLERGAERNKVLFVHDRVKDAFYEKIPDAEKAGLHLMIAKAIEEAKMAGPDESVFDLANHYMLAGDKDKTLQYALPAAERAREGYANEEAVKYYNIAIGILEEKERRNSAEWVTAKEGLTSVYLTIGKNDEVISLTLEIMPLKKTALEKAEAYRCIGNAYFKKGDLKNGEKNMAMGLNMLGEKLPGSRAAVILSLAKELSIHLLRSFLPILFIRKGKHRFRPEDEEIVLIYDRLFWTYVLSDMTRFLRVCFRVMNLARARMEGGRGYVKALMMYGALWAGLLYYQKTISIIPLVQKIEEGYKDEWGAAQNQQLFGYVYTWKGDYAASVNYFSQSMEKFQRIGDVWELAQSVNGIGYSYRYLGDYCKSIESFYSYLELSKKIKDSVGISSSRVVSFKLLYRNGKLSGGRGTCNNIPCCWRSK